MASHTGYKLLTADLRSCGMPLPDHGGPERWGGYQFAVGELTEAMIPARRVVTAGAGGATYGGIDYDEGETYHVDHAVPNGITAYDDADGYTLERDGVQLLSSNVFVSVEFEDADLLSFRAYGRKVNGDARSQVNLARCTVIEILASGPYA